MFFTIEKIEKQLKEIRAAIHREGIPIPRFKFLQSECPGAEKPDFDDSGWADFQVGDTWGGYDITAWFRTRLQVPPEWRGRKLVLRFLVGPRDGGNSTAETLLYVNGHPLQGIDAWHPEAWLPPEILVEGQLQISLKAWSGVLDPPDRRRFKLAQLAWIDLGAERFYYLADTLLSSVKLLDENDLRRVKLLDLLNRAFAVIDFLKPRSDSFYHSLAEASGCLSDGLAHLQTREIKPRVTGIGQSHIDMAWLWRLRHSREKAARTFSTVLNLMRQYPEYRFMHASPQLYAFLKEDYPEIYAQVKEKIASGEWEITGGMWVEADTNIPSGESLVRQLLFGRRFVREEFGQDMQVLWLPDVFGYSWALPQIVKKSGMQYFMTTKISWSQFNRFPYDTFYWRGVDGTEMLTHFVTTPDPDAPYYTYNGRLSPADVKGIWDNYRQKDVNDELLLLYGWGDGGGGPTQEMLESGLGLKNVPGIPEVALGFAEPYFERLSRRVSAQELPVWDGELYLEYHRGTYTSQAQNKRFNRQAETLYHDAEWLSALAELVSGDRCYPAESLRRGWELILLNQFHDILPGSSIRQVYEDCRQDYVQVFQIGEAVIDRAKEILVGAPASEPQAVFVFNALSWERGGLIELPWNETLAGGALQAAGGQLSRAQVTESGGEKKLLFEVAGVPPLGYRRYPLAVPQRVVNQLELSLAGSQGGHTETGGSNGGSDGRSGQQEEAVLLPGLRTTPVTPEKGGEIRVETGLLENAFYDLQFNSLGQIVSIWDKRCGREVLAPGALGNLLQVFEDKPLNFDAWDMDIFYQEKERTIDDLVEAVMEERGPLRSSLRLVWRFGDSTITQRLRLYRSSPRIDFVTEVDWHEHQVLLKVAFPVAIRSTRATYGIQFGSIERPTHWNTSWDWARFEVVGHKWVDLSEGDYGVALLNDCKYGHDVKKDVLRLTLIKSAVSPDPQADQGRHVFTYSLLPHAGDWRSGGVVPAAYELNDPLAAVMGTEGLPDNRPSQFRFAALDCDHVMVETVKQAEDGEAWIVRLYEYQQRRSPAVHLSFGRPVNRAVECNLMEEDEQPVAYDAGGLTFAIRPFEIKTFKVWF